MEEASAPKDCGSQRKEAPFRHQARRSGSRCSQRSWSIERSNAVGNAVLCVGRQHIGKSSSRLKTLAIRPANRTQRGLCTSTRSALTEYLPPRTGGGGSAPASASCLRYRPLLMDPLVR